MQMVFGNPLSNVTAGYNRQDRTSTKPADPPASGPADSDLTLSLKVLAAPLTADPAAPGMSGVLAACAVTVIPHLKRRGTVSVYWRHRYYWPVPMKPGWARDSLTPMLMVKTRCCQSWRRRRKAATARPNCPCCHCERP